MENNNKKTKDNIFVIHDKRLDEVCNRLNELYKEVVPLRKEYYRIMNSFRTYKSRGIITQEEYDERADKFKYVRRRNKKGE